MVETKTCSRVAVVETTAVSQPNQISAHVCVIPSASMPLDYYYDSCHGVCHGLYPGDGSTERRAKQFQVKRPKRRKKKTPAGRPKPSERVEVAKADRSAAKEPPKVAVAVMPSAPAKRANVQVPTPPPRPSATLQILNPAVGVEMVARTIADGARVMILMILPDAAPRAGAKVETRSASSSGAPASEILGRFSDPAVRGGMMIRHSDIPRISATESRSQTMAAGQDRAPSMNPQRAAMPSATQGGHAPPLARTAIAQHPVRLIARERAHVPSASRDAGKVPIGPYVSIARKPRPNVVFQEGCLIPDLNPAEAAVALAQAGMLVPPDEPLRGRGAGPGAPRMNRERNSMVAKASPGKEPNDERQGDRRKEDEGRTGDDSAESAV